MPLADYLQNRGQALGKNLDYETAEAKRDRIRNEERKRHAARGMEELKRAYGVE